MSILTSLSSLWTTISQWFVSLTVVQWWLSIWNKFAMWVAGTGENQLFVDFMAHAGIPAFFVLFVGLTSIHVGIGFAAVWYIVTAIKEFWFDRKYEKNPVQTFLASARDYAGYFTGISVGLASFLYLKLFLGA